MSGPQGPGAAPPVEQDPSEAQGPGAHEAGAGRTGDPGNPPPARRRRGRPAWLAANLAFPLAVVALFLGLVAANVNGASIGALRTTSGEDPSLVAGTPRLVRSDEFMIATPLGVSAARQDFPDRPYVGLTPTALQTTTHTAPTWSPLEILKPNDWGYLVLGAHRGLAVHWWFPFLVSLLGMFWLLRLLAVGPWMSSALAVLATMTPYNAWWSAPSPALLMGYGAVAGAAAICALRATRLAVTLAWGVAAGAATSALFLTLYPPWVVSVGIVVAAVVLGYALDLRVGWRRPLVALIGLLAVSLPVTIGWYLTYSRDIAAQAGTFYPGHRLSVPGEATLTWLLSAPLNPLFAGEPGTTVSSERSGILFTNLSETSASWLPLPILGAAALVAAVRWVRWPRRAGVGGDAHPAHGELGVAPAADGGDVHPAGGSRGKDVAAAPGPWTVAGLVAALVLLLAWALLPLPEWVGTLFLERVKGIRLPLALGMAAVLLVAMVGSVRRVRVAPRHRIGEAVLWSAAVVATVWLTLWTADHLPWDPGTVSTKRVLVFGVVVAVGFGLIASGFLRRTAATSLAVFATWSWALVNPLYHGLGPLDTDPVVRAMRPIAQAEPGARVMVFSDVMIAALVRSSGLQSLSGTTFYPNEDLMRRFVPGQHNLWNNYATYRWVPEPAGTRAFIRQVKGTSMELHLDPCAPELEPLGATWALSEQPLQAPCMQVTKVVPAGERTFYQYRIVR